MKLRTPILLAAIAGLLAALFAALPAEAAGRYYAFLKTTNVSISSSGTGKVAIACHSKSTCKGKVSFSKDTGTPRARSYAVKGGKTAYVSVAMHTNAPINPHKAPAVPGRDFKSVSNVQVKIVESSPRKITHYYSRVTTETPVTRQYITGTVTGVGGNLARNVRVDLIRVLRGGNIQVVKGQDITSNGGSYSLGVNLGTNNARGKPYRLRIRGTDQNGVRRSWYWRGADNSPAGGGAHVREGTVISVDKYDKFDANFTYGSIAGTTANKAEVTVASMPRSFSGGTATLRELDIPFCANIFGQTRASSTTGRYRVDFLPVTSSTNNRYLVGAKNGSTEAWYGKAGTRRFGSCYDATGYARSRANLITLTSSASPLIRDLPANASGNTLRVKAVYSSAYKPTAQGDRWIRIRERIPGLKILDTPVIAEGYASSASRDRTFRNMPPGKYTVEVGRRTGCSDWYPSKYANNSAYFKGADRGAERWKSFKRLRDLPGNANSGYEYIARHVSPNPARGAEQNTVRKGYAGWMYRGYCKAYGAGTVNATSIVGTGQTVTKTTSRNPKGAVVRGRVTRAGGRTNKEIMVRLSSSLGTRVIRTDLTDSKGNFYIAGLPSGNWRVSVNSDSWRGIGRSFTGKKTIRVKAGKNYNLGTLRFTR